MRDDQTADVETIRASSVGKGVWPRLLGAGLEQLADFRHTQTRTSELFVELDRLFPVVGYVRPALGGWRDALLKLRAFHPDRDSWRGRWALSPRAFRLRTELVEHELEQWAGAYDLVFQLQTVFAPGTSLRAPYTIYTDNIHTMTQRYYPGWAPLGRSAREWIELEAATCRGASYVFAWSEFLRDALLADYGLEPERVVVAGAAARAIAPSLEGKRWDRQVALFVGNKFELKGGRTLLQAWELVRDRLPDATLQIAGPKRDPGGGAGVDWLGLLDWPELERRYREASVFVLPTLYDAFGLVFPEAMGQGLPVIGTDHCAMPEIIREAVDGLLVPPRDAEPLAEALVTLLGDPVRAEAMGRAGYESVHERWTYRAVAERMAAPIEAAVAG
jgi:glycosyltransferase involved in cell wall biosynthesis